MQKEAAGGGARGPALAPLRAQAVVEALDDLPELAVERVVAVDGVLDRCARERAGGGEGETFSAFPAALPSGICVRRPRRTVELVALEQIVEVGAGGAESVDPEDLVVGSPGRQKSKSLGQRWLLRAESQQRRRIRASLLPPRASFCGGGTQGFAASGVFGGLK